MKERSLPLGVDLGVSRVRVAALSLRRDGSMRLRGIGAADVDGDIATALDAALGTLEDRERRCNLAVRASEAPIRCVRLPRMNPAERARAARFEATAMPGILAGPVIARSMALDDGRTLITCAPADRVRSLVATARAAGLRPVAVVHEALVHGLADAEALLDVGFERSTLHARVRAAPIVRTVPAGGETFTEALAHTFATSRAIAEARKKAIGIPGGGEALLDFARAIEHVVSELRAREDARIERLRLCGNGARLHGLLDALERALGVPVTNVALPEALETGVPPDIERAGALDWFSSIAIATGARRLAESP